MMACALRNRARFPMRVARDHRGDQYFHSRSLDAERPDFGYFLRR
jgi:hypothetical protein